MYYKGINLTNLNDIEIYDLVLKRKLPNFPPGYWCSVTNQKGENIALQLLKYLIEDKLNLYREQVINILSKEFIINSKLWTPCKLYFGKSVIRYLMKLYPYEYREFEFVNCRVSQGYWNKKENRISAIKWLIEDKLMWNIEEVKQNFDKEILVKYGLATIATYYTSSFNIINEIYPNQIYRWELKKSSVSVKYWDCKVNRIKAIRWLIDQKLQFSHEQVIDNLSVEDFVSNKLSTLICNYYNKSIIKAVIEAYHEEFKEWEFGYYKWSLDEARKATKWLINKVQKEGRKNISDIKFEDFKKNKLRTPVDKFYGGSYKKAINDAIING